MAILKNIQWTSEDRNTIIHKFDFGNDQVNKGSALTVRESQAAIFIYKGKLADVFLPGFYKLDTDNMPVLTKMMSWKYGFQTPFKADIYFVNTKQFINQTEGSYIHEIKEPLVDKLKIGDLVLLVPYGEKFIISSKVVSI